MHVIGQKNWDNVDISNEDDLIEGYIPLPDESQHLIKMIIGEWYVLDFMMDRGHTPQGIAQEVLEGLTERNLPLDLFDEMFRISIRAYGKKRAELAHARGRTEL